jgi:phage terminase large subunit-like protein
METWDNAMLGMREAKIEQPRIVATTTPRPNRLMKRLLSGDNPWIRVTTGSSYDNFANLSPMYYEAVIKPLEGTTLGQQEIWAHLMSEDPRALWKRSIIDENRRDKYPALIRIVVAIDPAGGGEEDNDEVGICVAGLGADGHGYILEDRSGRMSAGEWGREGVDAYLVRRADRIIGEANFGGDMVEAPRHRTVKRW